MEQITPYYQKTIFVCTNMRDDGRESCAQKGSVDLAARMKDYVKERGLAGKIRISKSGCQDLCAQGTIVSVFPDNVRYGSVTENDIAKIIEETSRDLK